MNGHAAYPCDLGRLRSPWRYSAEPGNDYDLVTTMGLLSLTTISQQRIKNCKLHVRQIALGMDEVQITDCDATNRRVTARELQAQTLQTKRSFSPWPEQLQHGHDSNNLKPLTGVVLLS